MSALLEKLGVPKNVRLFFKPWCQVLPDGSLRFAFGQDYEHFGKTFHRIPIPVHSWTAGSGPVQFMAFSAMECVAFLSIYAYRYRNFDALQFTAVGITQQLPPLVKPGRLCLLTGSDTLGRLNAIHWANALQNKRVPIRYLPQDKYLLTYLKRQVILSEPRVSLSAAEKSLGIRTGIRTSAPKSYISFLEQLKNQSSWY